MLRKYVERSESLLYVHFSANAWGVRSSMAPMLAQPEDLGSS